MANWFTTIANAVYREYDRRIRRASLITEYGDSHHTPHDEDEDDDVVISNVPRGTTVHPPPRDE